MAMEPLVEIEAGQGPRSTGIPYQALLDLESRPVPDTLRIESAREIPAVKVPIERYTSRAFHDLEVEKVWKKTWQFACREEQIPEPGDHFVYDIANLSLVIVRGPDREIRAFHNVCLHRGRKLKDHAGGGHELRCPFHGWTWDLDGSLKTVPCRWDFPHVDRDDYALPEAKVGTWGGFVFVNMDPNCDSLESHLGDLPKHFERWPLEDRFIQGHVEKLMRCNWKVCQEAFMEAYHVVATHPQLIPGIGDTNSQYDAWDTFSRAITPNMTPSPHIQWTPTEQEMFDAIGTPDLDAPNSLRVPEGMTARQFAGVIGRMQLKGVAPGVEDLTDAELNDSFYYSLFPNFHPWASYNRITYRFRPYGNEPDKCIMDVFMLAPFRGKRPKPAETTRVGFDDSFLDAIDAVGPLAKIFSQDAFNLPGVQKGLEAAQHEHVTFAEYQETKLRHFHTLLEKQLNA